MPHRLFFLDPTLSNGNGSGQKPVGQVSDFRNQPCTRVRGTRHHCIAAAEGALRLLFAHEGENARVALSGF